MTVSSIATNGMLGATPYIQNSNGSTVANATLTINGGATKTFTGVVRDGNGTGGGTLSLNIAGGSSLTLTGANTYTGNTTVTNGTLSLAAASSTPSPLRRLLTSLQVEH